jgi:hypothetical protein
MVQSVQQGVTRRQGPPDRRGRGAARKSGFWALLAVALLVVALVVVVAGCGSNSQASTGASTATSVAASGQSNTGQSGTGQSTTGQSFPSGPPSGSNGQMPSGSPGSSTSSTDTAGTTTTTAAPVADTTTTAAPTTTTSLDDGQYGDGIYKAGTDVSSGLYKGSVVATGAHWEISSDANGLRYVASGDPTGPFYVKVTSGQYLKVNGAIIAKASSDAADPLATTGLTNGTYRVGYDIEAGWYTGKVTGDTTMGYWQISSDANGQKLVASDYPMGTFTFKVKDGQYVTLRGVTIDFHSED